ncbi:ROK family protein [Anaerocolumna sedimenticola]|uniref:ROK family protein n=1 Tax=Anaerocolumna sedimenticola TaxID=2696063 RepID=A0A6P1TKT0_9FIRM|nr:ROK family transcriptional regulator [Anaerocolumna sedimenticola]QHQ60516.1 ROK family protein [Anaerocolumna sedimenticola]
MKLVNQHLIKDSNMKLLYNAIYNNSGISRAQLAKLSNLSKTTVSTLIDELINRGFVYDSGVTDSNNVGRKPNSLHVKPSSYYVVVFSWIENFVNLYLMDITGATTFELHLKLEGDDTYVSLSRKCMDENILTQVNREQILGVCVVVSAMIDAVNEEIYSTTLSLPKSEGMNLIASLKSTFREFPVAILEDTACSAYAEKVYARVTEPDFAFINFSRGIGATLFIRNKMVGKANGASTQFGHYTADPDGVLCACGNRGCLEAMMGESALAKMVKSEGGSPALDRLPAITFATLGNAALYGDAVSKKVIKEIAHVLSYGLANLISIVNPHLIILGGKSILLGDLFLEEINKNLKSTGFRRMVDNVEVQYSKLDSNAFLNGAMKYFFDVHYAFTKDLSNSFFIG